MPINSLDDYISAPKQRVLLHKTASRTTVALTPFTVFDLAGIPGAGTLAIGNTANGTVPTDAVAGYPIINAFGTGAVGYVSKVDISNNVASRLVLFDRLFAAGAYAFDANVTLSSQPSYSSRVPNGTNFSGLEIWVEAVTAFTGNPSFNIGYTNQAGTTGRSTGVVASGAALTVGRMLQLPLQAGDSGVQRIDSVVATVATAGTFNVMVLRRIAEARIPIGGAVVTLDLLATGMPVIFDNSAFYMVVQADGTSSGLPNIVAEVANK